MKYGLTDEMLRGMEEVFQQYPAITRVVLFGSRAMGTYRTGSDIDLAIEGKDLQFSHVLRLYSALEELNPFYKFDLLNKQKLTNEVLLDHIRRIGVAIYEHDKVAVY